MATAFSGKFKMDFNGTMTEALDLSTPKDSVRSGTSNFDSNAVTITNGTTGADKGDTQWHDEITIGAGANEDLDLTSLAGPFGATLGFSRIMIFHLDVDSPDGAKLVRVGPQGVSNAFQGWFGGVAASNYETVEQTLGRTNTKGSTPGWTVTAGTGDILRIHNPGASAVTVRIWIVGVA